MIEELDGFRVLALDHDQEFYRLDRGTICNFRRLPYQYLLPKKGNTKNAQNHWLCA